MKDALGDRMKSFYEGRTKTLLPRRTYTIIRIDGKAFHTYTKGLNRPFDDGFVEDMDLTAAYLCKNIQGAKFAFVQSDEISILLTDFDKLQTDAWFDGNVQKMVSVSASMATAKFNQLRFRRSLLENQVNFYDKLKVDFEIANQKDGIFNKSTALQSNQKCFNDCKLAEFDSRAFTIPSATEVENYFIWRQQDTVRNSISSVAQSLYSHKELNGVKTDQMQEMCFQKGVNWNDIDPKLKRGRLIVRMVEEGSERSRWVSTGSPTFTQERECLDSLIPIN